MRLLLPLALVVSLLAPGSESVESMEVLKAKQELQRIEKLVADGGLPRNKLDEARSAVQEAEQQAFLRRTLYGSLKMEDLNEPLTRQMLESAKNLIERQERRIAAQQRLVEAGVVSRLSLDPLKEELALRHKTLEVAEAQARLWNDLAEMARAEQQRQSEAEQTAATEDEPSYGGLPPTRLRAIEKEFETAFSRNLPVSAKGDTAFHRTMGLNHTGRVDVAVNPDSAEGQWLRRYLDRTGIPYLAFRTAVKGAATAPHIHIGPPSTRLRSSD
ncbi:MAG: hypothetical protein JST93_28615 [Acidobacteria bacterium]|nr:hypothetical protein [Acidobacteriota bacterium]